MTEDGQRRRAAIVLSGVVGIALAAVLVVGLTLTGGGGAGSAGDGSGAGATTQPIAAPPGVMAAVGSVPAAAFDAVGVGSATPSSTAGSGEPLTLHGKPEVLFIGAEFCPYCAAQRWALAVALSRFGRLHHVGQIRSSEDDIATLAFRGTTFTSRYLAFVPREVADQRGRALQRLTAAQTAVWTAGTNGRRSYPFIDVGNSTIVSGASFQPQALFGLDQQQIAAHLNDPGNDVALGVDGAANLLTAAFCGVTDQLPAAVCGSRAVTALENPSAA